MDANLHTGRALGIAGALVAAALLLVMPASAAAQGPSISGQYVRDAASPTGMKAQLRSALDGPGEQLELTLSQPGYKFVPRERPPGSFFNDEIILSGAPGQCFVQGSGDQINCGFFSPGWPVGGDIEIRGFDVSAGGGEAYPDLGGGQVEACVEPCTGPAQRRGPFPIQGPGGGEPGGGGSPGGKAADLSVKLRPPEAYIPPVGFAPPGVSSEPEADSRSSHAPPVNLVLTFEVTNLGPDPAVLSALSFNLPLSPPGTVITGFRPCDQYICFFGTMPSGSTRDGFFEVGLRAPGALNVFASAYSETPDPQISNDDAQRTFGNHVLPDLRRIRAGGLDADKPAVKVAAEGAESVHVAVAQAQGGARITQAASARATSSCEWVKNAKGKLEAEKPGSEACSQPIWLETRKGKKKGSFELKLKRPLEPGKYLVLGRAVAESGAFEATFSKKDGNLAKAKLSP